MCGLLVVANLILISAFVFLSGIAAAILADHWETND